MKGKLSCDASVGWLACSRYPINTVELNWFHIWVTCMHVADQSFRSGWLLHKQAINRSGVKHVQLPSSPSKSLTQNLITNNNSHCSN